MGLQIETGRTCIYPSYKAQYCTLYRIRRAFQICPYCCYEHLYMRLHERLEHENRRGLTYMRPISKYGIYYVSTFFSFGELRTNKTINLTHLFLNAPFKLIPASCLTYKAKPGQFIREPVSHPKQRVAPSRPPLGNLSRERSSTSLSYFCWK